MQLVLSTAMMANLLFPTPAGSVAARFIARATLPNTRSSPASVARFFLKTTLVATLVLACSVVGIQGFGFAADRVVAVMSGAMTIAFAGRALSEGFHAGLGRMHRLGTWSILVSGVSVIGTALLLIAGVHSAAVLLPLLACNLALALRSLPPKDAALSPDERSEALRYIGLGATGTIASSGLAQSAVLAASALNGLEYVGQYSAAMTLTTPFAMLASALSLVLFPALAKAHSNDDLELQRRLTDTATRRLGSALILGGLILAPLAPSLVRLLWGESFHEAASIVPLLALAAIVNGISVPAVTALTSRSTRGMFLSATFSWIGFAAAIVIAVVLQLATVGGAVPIAYAAGVAVIALLPLAHTWRVLSLRWGGFAAKTAAGLACLLTVGLWSASYDLSPLHAIMIALVFSAAWLGINLKDFRALGRTIVATRSAG
ncbi:lipopolysaccharide biosynthesis protein [Microbacterium keratanolyticum]|uniref:lipopolysaccharide biosynthesis protein n=1 Tax=Microbacterium keratanolyticum TaxID=67574 RepID=UPI0036448997